MPQTQIYATSSNEKTVRKTAHQKRWPRLSIWGVHRIHSLFLAPLWLESFRA